MHETYGMRSSIRTLTILSFIAHVAVIAAAMFLQSRASVKELYKPTIVHVELVERTSVAEPSPVVTQPEAAPVEEPKREEAKKEESKKEEKKPATIIKPKEIDKDALKKKLESLEKKVAKKKAEAKASDKIAALEKRLSEKKKTESAKAVYPAVSAGDELPNDYYDLVAARVRAAWIYPGDAPPDLMVSLEITMRPDGEVTDIAIKKRSGNTLYDNTVLKAIKKASPLPPPPKGFKGVVGFRFCPVKCK